MFYIIDKINGLWSKLPIHMNITTINKTFFEHFEVRFIFKGGISPLDLTKFIIYFHFIQLLISFIYLKIIQKEVCIYRYKKWVLV